MAAITDPKNHAVASRDESFLANDDVRPLRILAEYREPEQALRRRRIQDAIVFVGSARLRPGGPLSGYYEEARELARLVTRWSRSVASPNHHFVVCTRGGSGIMEAANRGATEAGGPAIGLNSGSPHEHRPNRYLSPDLSFQFRDSFMCKLWFARLARALVVFPGGFEALDELAETLNLAQSGKPERRIPILLYGSVYWKEIVNFDALVRYGAIAPEDLRLCAYVDDPQSALRIVQKHAVAEPERDAARSSS
jgi:uncharacterized protein (TIGR00730 family)